jgi:AraC-like DNA-binding protein
MLLDFEQRPSDSPFIERVWRTHSENAGAFISLALSHWQMCVWKGQGKTTVTVRGPETKATRAVCPPDTEFIGIVFRLGSFMPYLPARNLVDGDLNLPDASGRSFWLNGFTWAFPAYDSVEAFVDRLVREELLVCEPLVQAAVQGEALDWSLRSVQRRVWHATGLSRAAILQIDRARYAVSRLMEGAAILDVVAEAGYADQPHLTRSLRRFAGLTPAQLAPARLRETLSFLFKTNPFP